MVTLLKSIEKHIVVDNKQFKASFNTLNWNVTKVQESLVVVMSRLSAMEEENKILKEECEELKLENFDLTKRVRDDEWSVIEHDQYQERRCREPCCSTDWQSGHFRCFGVSDQGD